MVLVAVVAVIVAVMVVAMMVVAEAEPVRQRLQHASLTGIW